MLKRLHTKLFAENLIFIKTQFFLTILIVLPIIILGVMSVTHVKNVLINNFRESNYRLLNQSGLVINLIIENMLDISKQVFNDRDLSRILDESQITGYTDRSIALSKVKQIKNSSSLIDSVYLYLGNSDVIVSSNRGYESFSEFNDKFFLERYIKDKENFILTETHTVTTTGAPGRNANVFSVLTKLPIEKTSDHSGAIIINIKQSLIADSIMNTMSSGSEGLCYILDEKHRIVFSKDEDQLYMPAKENPYLSGDMAGDNGFFISFIENRPYLTVFSKMPSRSWTFVSVFSYEAAYSSIGLVQNMVIITGLLLVFVSILFSAWITSKTVTPMRDLLAFVQNKAGGKGEYFKANSIRGIVSGVIAYNEEVEYRLNEALPVYKEKFFNNLIMKGNMHPAEILKKLDELGIDMPLDNLLLALVELDDYDIISVDADYNDSMVKFAIRVILEEKLHELNMYAFSAETEPNRIVLITSAKNLTAVYEKLKIVQSEINEKLGVFISIVLCGAPASAQSLRDIYKECVNGVKYKYSYGKNQVVRLNEIEIKDGDFATDYPTDKIEFMLNYICSGEKTNAFNMVESIINEHCKGKSYLYTQYVFVNVNSAITALIKELGLSYESFYTKDSSLMEDIIKLRDMDEIELGFKEIIERLTTHIQQNKNDKTDKYLKKIVQYIGDHYMEQISLDDLCGHVELSQTYVCQLFKTHIHKTFTQYLSEVRINQACELLGKGDIKTKDVAEKVGFMSSGYFIKVFKEMKGVTPGEYR
ncbi:hypothetical protein FACS1894191_3480 [Clostridia bacterium]|nr:hypothetical protein FACS1894191_3480 [Clostridia bacterium]